MVRIFGERRACRYLYESKTQRFQRGGSATLKGGAITNTRITLHNHTVMPARSSHAHPPECDRPTATTHWQGFSTKDDDDEQGHLLVIVVPLSLGDGDASGMREWVCSHGSNLPHASSPPS